MTNRDAGYKQLSEKRARAPLEIALHDAHFEDTPAYKALKEAGVLCREHRRCSVDDIFTGRDLTANTDARQNIMERMHYGWCIPGLGCCLYDSTHTEMFVPAGHVGLLMDASNRYLFAQPGMHNIRSMFIRKSGNPVPLRKHIRHGNRTIVIIEQGFIGYAIDNGQPKLLAPGIHVWTSESMDFVRSLPLNDHIITLGPYTLVTVDEGYAAVTQNNGKMVILEGGHTHFLDHKNWRFEKFISRKVQTDELDRIEATSADNINMNVTSTVNWRIVDVEVAATMAAETMAVSGRDSDVSADISKLRRDVLKQAIASLAAFIGSVNYSNSFHVAAANQTQNPEGAAPPVAEVRVCNADDDEKPKPLFNDNPLYNEEKMSSAVEHANHITRTYGVEIMSINIISATPVDEALTRALASGAVASAEALQAETAARGQARAIAIQAEAEAKRAKIAAEGTAQSAIIEAKGRAEAERIQAQGSKQAADLLSTSELAIDLAKMGKSAEMLSGKEKFFFGQEPSMLSNIILKGAV